ncbi:hypothetical protein M422DRAFT_84217, partial [Sphaerobolus stellatus SS14]
PANLNLWRAICLLGTLLHSITTPFTDPNFSLTQQLEALSLTSHIAMFLMFKHGTAFISGQLYHDLQCMIKNTFFCVAKQRILDPTAKFYFCQLGDDRLEGQFGTVRRLIHDRNVDALQLTERLSAAGQVDELLWKYPTWDRGHRRLKLQGSEGVDHVNPASWIGDVSVLPVNLHSCWYKGRKGAEKA